MPLSSSSGVGEGLERAKMNLPEWAFDPDCGCCILGCLGDEVCWCCLALCGCDCHGTDFHSLQCTCETCIQNHPERELGC